MNTDSTEVKNTEDVTTDTGVMDKTDVPQPFPENATPGVAGLPPIPAQVQPPMATSGAIPAFPQTVTPAPVTVKFVSSASYILSGDFDRDILRNQAFKNRKTGFPNIDAIHPFQPGLYMIVGTTSLGKTTFALQMCDQIASQGEYVLYFSLEQTRCEIVSKSLSRKFFQEFRKDEEQNGYSSLPKYTSMEIRNKCVDPNELNQQKHNYIQETQGRVYIIESNFSGDIEDICACVELFIEHTKQIPVVLIDYLQIVESLKTPNGNMMDTKTNMDQTAHKLKQFQSENNLTVIAISSLSRQGYTDPVDMANIKESGSLEYTSDFVWGLQLSVVSNFVNSDKRLNEAQKKVMIQNAKGADPRKIDLVYLKDRCGRVGNVVSFDYFPAYETFVSL